MATMADTVTLVRHGATEWSVSGQHTSTTDLPLLPEGEQGALDVAARLDPAGFAEVLTSPLKRARRTAVSPPAAIASWSGSAPRPAPSWSSRTAMCCGC